MKSKSIFQYSWIIYIALFLVGCNKDLLEPTNEDFNVKSFISNIKSYNVNADYVENNIIPADTTSTEKPYLSVQSWVIKGKDILMSITVPDDAEELYFGAINSQAEYMGLDFKGQDQKTATGYYRLMLKNLTKSGTISNSDGLTNYQVVLSSNEDIQLDKFDLIASYKTSNGVSNKTTVPLDVISIAPYQKNLKVGFMPLSGYTYTINITTPAGGQITYSYNKNTGSETFNNSQSPNSILSYDSGLDFKWIDFTDPQFGGYTMTATIQIDLSEGSQYIYLYLAIITEGRIEQVSLDADVQQTGQNMAVGTANVGFSYFEEFKNIYVNILAYKPVNYQMLNPTQANCANELFEVVPESNEEIPGVGLRTCKNCLSEFLSSKITLEVINQDYTPEKLHFWLKTNGSPLGSFSIWEDENLNNLLIFDNKEVEIKIPNFQNSHYSKDIWIKTDGYNFKNAQLTFIVMDDLGKVLSKDIVNFYPITIKKVSLKGLNTFDVHHLAGNGPGHNWLTIQHPETNSEISFGFWPQNNTLSSSVGIIAESLGEFDYPEIIKYFDYSHTFYLKSENVEKLLNYKSSIKSNLTYWRSPFLSKPFDCSTFVTEALFEAGIKIPIMHWPNDVEVWLNEFKKDN